MQMHRRYLESFRQEYNLFTAVEKYQFGSVFTNPGPTAR